MAIKYVQVKIRRNELHTLEDSYPTWELPILEAMHGSGVTVTKEFAVTRDTPTAEEEYQRLDNRYRRMENEDGSKGMPYVAAVYGQHALGINRLREAIEAAIADDDEVGLDLLKAS